MLPKHTRKKIVLALWDIGFLHPRVFRDDHWAGVIQLGSFASIVDGECDPETIRYTHRWIYRSLAGATHALEKWDGEGEPMGFVTALRSPKSPLIAL